MKGEGMVANYGLQSLGKTKSAEFQADSIVAQGQAQGQASMAKALASGISSLLVALVQWGWRWWWAYGGKYNFNKTVSSYAHA